MKTWCFHSGNLQPGLDSLRTSQLCSTQNQPLKLRDWKLDLTTQSCKCPALRPDSLRAGKAAALQTPLGFSGGSAVKNPSASARDAGDMGSIPGSGRSPGGGFGNPLQYSRLENSMNRGAWRATVRGVARSQTRLSNEAGTHTVIL